MVYREWEPDFYLKGIQSQRLENYEIPKASRKEILIEKSPEYLSGGPDILAYRARRMKTVNPDVKILVFLCDPVKRYEIIFIMIRDTCNLR